MEATCAEGVEEVDRALSSVVVVVMLVLHFPSRLSTGDDFCVFPREPCRPVFCAIGSTHPFFLVVSLLSFYSHLHPNLPLTPSTTPPFLPSLAARVLHARLPSWFPDVPPASFSLHRIALADKAAWKDVGMWSLVDAFRSCGMGMCVATDSTLYQSEVHATSCSPEALTRVRLGTSTRGGYSTKTAAGVKPETRARGDHPVLLLLGIRLGLDGVNPILRYAQGALHLPPVRRPSSSYYFVGVQGHGLFYLDLYYKRPAVPLRLVTHGEEAHASCSTRIYEPGLCAWAARAPVQLRAHDKDRGPARRRASARAAAGVVNSSTSTDVTPAGGRLSAAEEALYARACLPPLWGGMDDADDMELESLLDPEKAADADIDGGGDMSSASPAESSGFHSCTGSTTRSKSTTSSSSARSEVDTEGNPVAPITPLPGSCFDLSRAPVSMKRTVSGDTDADAKGFVDASDELPAPLPPPAKKSSSKGKGKCKGKKAVPAPVPSVHYLSPVSAEDEGVSLSSSPRDQRDRDRCCRVGGGATNASAAASGSQRVDTTRARDGGRTQSVGVHGMLTEDQ
ncbi:hypothetical protein K438DRAFT_2027802 [Mycena galopus ATCC 62051]|nr:hypothetical protein K438DRAFT_2027802 [Mycena galopus ATCC 62051]